jgi:hypothetical protein
LRCFYHGRPLSSLNGHDAFEFLGTLSHGIKTHLSLFFVEYRIFKRSVYIKVLHTRIQGQTSGIVLVLGQKIQQC